MEPRKGTVPIGVTEPLIRVCGETAMGLHLEAVSSCESCDVNLPEPQPTRTLKWTAFKLFGGRRSICTLPSFFRSRKCHGKGTSKKGINKSKTHDGISKVSWEDGGRAGDMPTKDFEYHRQKDSALPSSKSSQVMNELSEGGVSSCLPTVSGDHKAFWDKSLHFRRPKRGLKGFFSSLRCPKKHRNVESGNRETFELSGDISEHTMHSTESEIDNHDPKSVGNLAEPKAPASDVKDTLTVACEVNKEVIVSVNPVDCTDQDSTDRDSLKSLTGVATALEPAANALNVAIEVEAPSSNVDLTIASVARLDLAESSERSVQSPEHVYVISADEASLKSFDSLTGCGDVIADQDEDGVADRTVVREKSCSAAKRSSSYVNFQGGGEEMATPDEVDYLRGLWESDTVDEVGSFPREHPGYVSCDVSLAVTEAPLIASPHMDAGGNCSSLQHGTGTSNAPIHVLTPQSDQQGSLPNSDEGYYDSTTPGPDEDRRHDLVGIANERLPRDSYSGDALYELYESEDPLTSPPVEGKHSVETLSSALDTLDFLCLTSQDPDEEHLREPQNVQNSTAKEQAEFKFCFKKSPAECITRLNEKQACQNEEQLQVISWIPSPKDECVSYEHRCLNDRNKNGKSVFCFEKSKDNHLDDTKDVICTAPIPKSALPLQDLTSCAVQVHQMDLPENQGKMSLSNKLEVGAEHGQTVCFSQALVNFTNDTRLFNNLSRSLVGPEQGSVFTQNMEALPAMVTFDVFDTENEGECDRHTEMDIELEMEMEMEGTDDDVESPYESSPYESYLQKDAFAEWDDKMLNDFDRSLLCSNAWGVASLPRYYGLGGISPPIPAALSAKRRSRSLDTDALESEISDLCLTKTKPKPVLIALPKSEQRSSKLSPLHFKTNGHLASPEMLGRAETTVSWQPQTSGSSVPSQTDEERIGWIEYALEREGAKPAFYQAEGPQSQHIGQGTKCKIRPQISMCAVQEKLGCNSTLQSPGQMVKSSHLPVQCGPRSFQPDASMPGTPGEFSRRASAQVSALDDRNPAHFSQKHFAKQLHKSTQPPSKIRPVGITRGMPHFRPDTNRTSKLTNCKKQRESTSKGREDLSVSLPVGCHKHSA
ncbi:APC membrane recruitment protein 1-like [Anguilla anguilla]|uniref:APC membrane recruitment protein 1-like n=1 Tax=Anguilla anguilla TaxID=7936 RepID=UPI0015B11E50|nr:APC membrane recruitment protein 1-like [Anguilla anguilla]